MVRFSASLAAVCVGGLMLTTPALGQPYVSNKAPTEIIILKNLQQFQSCIRKNNRVFEILGVHGPDSRKTIVVRYGVKSSDNRWDNGRVSVVRLDTSLKWLLSCSWGSGINGFGTAMRILSK